MTKDELHQFAAAGVAQKLAAMERELASYHKEWPELFLSPTPPQLLRAALKANGNGHWPPVMAPTKRDTAAPAQRESLVRAYLTGVESASMRDLMGYLADHGHALSNTSVIKVLRQIPEAAVVGVGYKARWVLKDHATPKKTKKTTRTLSLATRKKLALAMKRRHASGEIARAKAAKNGA